MKFHFVDASLITSLKFIFALSQNLKISLNNPIFKSL